MPAILEYDVQRAFTIWFKGERWKKGPHKGEWKSLPHGLPGVVAFHVPNGGERRDAFEGQRLQDSGVEAGIPDYWFLWGGSYGLEFKKPGGKQPPERQLNPAQEKMHPRLRAAGIVALETVDNLPDAKAFVIRHGLATEFPSTKR